MARPHTRPFDMTAPAMKGWIIVAREGVRTRRQLAPWVERYVRLERSLAAKGRA